MLHLVFLRISGMTDWHLMSHSHNWVYSRWYKSSLMGNLVRIQSKTSDRKLPTSRNVINYHTKESTWSRVRLTDYSPCAFLRIAEKMIKPLDCVGQRLPLHSTLQRRGSRENLRCGWYCKIQNTEEKRHRAGKSGEFKVDITKNNIWSFICYGKHRKLRHGLAFGKILM